MELLIQRDEFTLAFSETPELNPYGIAINQRVHVLHEPDSDVDIAPTETFRIRILDQGFSLVMTHGNELLRGWQQDIYAQIHRINKARGQRRPAHRNVFWATQPMRCIRAGQRLVFTPQISVQGHGSDHWYDWANRAPSYPTNPVRGVLAECIKPRQ